MDRKVIYKVTHGKDYMKRKAIHEPSDTNLKDPKKLSGELKQNFCKEQSLPPNNSAGCRGHLRDSQMKSALE